MHRCSASVVETNDNERGFMLENWLEPQCVSLHNKVDNYEEAIAIGGDLLVSAGKATESFTKRMISAVEEFGPYMVIAPGIAIPHARPEDGALAVGLSLITLDRVASRCSRKAGFASRRQTQCRRDSQRSGRV